MPKFAGDHSDAEPQEARTITGNPLVYSVLQAQAAAREQDDAARSLSIRRMSSAALRRMRPERIPEEYGSMITEYRANYRHEFNQLLAYGDQGSLLLPAPEPIPLSAAERRDLGIGTGAAGGFMVPQGFAESLVLSIASWSRIYANCRRLNTVDGAPLAVPIVSGDTTNSGVIQAENTSFTASETDVVVSQTTFNAYAIVSLPIKYSWQLALDAAPSRIEGDFAPANPDNTRARGGFNLLDGLATIVGERIGRKVGALLATGTGTGQPTGLSVGTRVGLTSATGHTTSVNGLSDILALEASVDPTYRDDAVFVTNPATWQSLVGTLETSTGVVYNAFDASSPPTLLGHPVLLDPNMPVMAASARHTYFGSLRRSYGVRTVGDPAMIVLRERFADQLQGAVICWQRLDGQVLDSKAGALLQNSAT